MDERLIDQQCSFDSLGLDARLAAGLRSLKLTHASLVQGATLFFVFAFGCDIANLRILMYLR